MHTAIPTVTSRSKRSPPMASDVSIETRFGDQNQRRIQHKIRFNRGVSDARPELETYCPTQGQKSVMYPKRNQFFIHKWTVYHSWDPKLQSVTYRHKSPRSVTYWSQFIEWDFLFFCVWLLLITSDFFFLFPLKIFCFVFVHVFV